MHLEVLQLNKVDGLAMSKLLEKVCGLLQSRRPVAWHRASAEHAVHVQHWGCGLVASHAPVS